MNGSWGRRASARRPAAAQGRLRLVSRCGGVGGAVAYELAAAGVGRLVLAHAGNVRPNDLNRQLLMTDDSVGRPRMEIAPKRLRELNPHVEVEAVAENVTEENVATLVGRVDLVAACAPCSVSGCCSTARRCGKTSRSSIAPCTIWNLSLPS